MKRQIPLVEVDFGYGGVSGDSGTVMLGPKTGDRSALRTDVADSLRRAGLEPVEGVAVLLVDRWADGDDHGQLCDMVVEGTLARDSDGWWCANYAATAMRWVLAEPQSQPLPPLDISRYIP